MSKKAIAVLISDIHFNLKTLEVASAAVAQAVNKADVLEIPLIIPGDLHDSKANIRAECVNAIKGALGQCRQNIYILVGNHDLINEKSEANALGFLHRSYIIDTPTRLSNNILMLPYYSDTNILKLILKETSKSNIIIMHQGLVSSNMGDYIQDKSAITKQDVAGRKIISGHYHTRQTIDLPDDGKWDYVGNPYTLTYGEAKDPEKGYQILYSDGSLEFVPTNLRKHVVVEYNVTELEARPQLRPVVNPNDLLWIKLSGPRDKLSTYNKGKMATLLQLDMPFKLDFYPDSINIAKNDNNTLTSEQLYNRMIETSNLEIATKTRLQSLWKQYANKVS